MNLNARRAHGKYPSNIQYSRDGLGYPIYEVTKFTLDNITNLIQTLQIKTREDMCDHYRTRVWAVRPRLLRCLYYDTFFSFVFSIRI